MALLEFIPGPQLSAFVLTYRVVHFVFEKYADTAVKPYPPRPEHCLSFYPRDTECVEYAVSEKKIQNVKVAIVGQSQEVTNRQVGQDFLVFQVVFRPGALYRITGIPMVNLANQYLDADSIFPGNVKEVNDKLNECGSYKDMVTVMESFLYQQAAKIKIGFHRIDAITNFVLSSDRIFSVDQLARESCLSFKQYERKFYERMGVSPKLFTKIARFEKAYRMKNKHPQLDWETIAIHCGYYDYQHLAKDYKQFTQRTPLAFHELDLSAPERKFGEADTY